MSGIEQKPENKPIRVSVVIPSKDSLTISDALQSIAVSASRDPSLPVEVILVDSSSNFPAVSSEITDRVDLRVIHKNLTRFEARVEGIRSARGDFILNLDADQKVHPDLLHALVQTTANSVVIFELPTESGRWDQLVHRTKLYELAEFRRHPSVELPVIPRWYHREPLMKAVELLVDVAAQNQGHLPTRHEDTILFWYFLKANRWTAKDSVGFADLPIYHPVPPLDETGRKFFRYGKELGVESRRIRRGESAIDPHAWRTVYRLDYRRLVSYWVSELGWNLPGLVYDLYRACFYGAGVVVGYGAQPSGNHGKSENQRL